MPVNAELANALKKAKSGPMKFAFIAKGSEGTLLVDRKIPPAAVKAAKSEMGGGTLYQGNCFGEDGLLVFEVPTEAPASLAGVIKHTITKDAGMSLNVEVRFNAGVTEEEGSTEQQEEQTTPAAKQDESAAFLARVKTILPTYKTALQSPNTEWVEQLKGVFAAMQNAFKAQDFATTNAQLKTLVQLLVKKPAAQETPATDQPSTDEDQFTARLKKVQPLYEKAKEIAPGLTGLMDQALAAAAEKLFANGLQLLDQLVDAIKAAAASRPKTTSTAPQQSVDGPGLKAWQQAAQKARYQVRRLQLALKLIEHQTAPEVVEILDGLVSELEKDPISLAEAAALEKFLQSDDRIDSAETPNPFGVEVRLREPLLAALAQRKAELAATA